MDQGMGSSQFKHFNDTGLNMYMVGYSGFKEHDDALVNSDPFFNE